MPMTRVVLYNLSCDNCGAELEFDPNTKKTIVLKTARKNKWKKLDGLWVCECCQVSTGETGPEREFQIWSSLSADHAVFYGTRTAHSLKEAVMRYAAGNHTFKEHLDLAKMTYCGDPLFDNERDARKGAS